MGLPPRSSRVVRTTSTLLVVATAVGADAATAQAVEADPNPLADIESELALSPFLLPFEVEAEGAVEATISGRLAVGDAGRALLEATGTFAGQAIDLLLVSDGEAVTAKWGELDRTEPTPDQICDALLIGLTRMGILHNVARLTGGALPDHGDGGVREWVTVHRGRDGDIGEPPGISVDLVVAGQQAGSAVLVLNPDGSPAVRRQTVVFPEGEMRVTERYRELRRGPLPEGMFRIGR